MNTEYQLRAAFEDLPAYQRRILTLYARDGLTCVQIANRLSKGKPKLGRLVELVVRQSLVEAYAELARKS